MEGMDNLVNTFRPRGKRSVKLYILEGRYMGQPGVIVLTIYSTSRVHCEYIPNIVHWVLIGDSSIIHVPQRHIHLLDPMFILPFGVLILKQL